MSKKTVVITMRLSPRDLERIEAVRTLKKIERSKLLKKFIENGLSQRVVHLYLRGKLTAGRAAEILKAARIIASYRQERETEA